MPESPNQPAPQARPTSKNHEPASASALSRISSKSPQQVPAPPLESAAKLALIDSQPMTTSSSSSSMPSEQQMDTTGASPYGTRSRNRNGNPRPNYAEDRELDMEFEWTSAKKSHAALGPVLSSSLQHGEGEKPPAGYIRHSTTAALNGVWNSNKATNSIVQNNHIPGLSSFSVHPDHNGSQAAPVPTRKRKAPGTGLSASYASPTSNHVPTSTTSRRNGAPPQPSRLRPTNLMTFEGCQCYLKNGKLKADDGTILAVNGTLKC